ncbi:MAG: ABC transporter permease [Tumebacillaceae bacterium]
MRQLWAICSFQIRRTFKNRRSWLLMFGMPLFFTFIFGSFAGKDVSTKIPIAISDGDHTTASQELISAVSKNQLYTVKTVSAEEATAQLHDKKVSGAIFIPAGYQQKFGDGFQAKVTFQHGPDLSTAPMIDNTLKETMAHSALEVKAAQSASRMSPSIKWEQEYQRIVDFYNKNYNFKVEMTSVTKNVGTLEMNGTNQRSIGFSIMFVMFSLMSVSGTILEARKNGVWFRLLSTPVTRLQVLGGYLLSFFLIGWIQFAILMVLSSLLFHVAWGNLTGLIVLVSALLLAVVGLGMFLAGLVKTTEQQSAIGSIIIVSTCMLGGVYWPLDIVSDTMRGIAQFVPQFWAMQGFTELVARGGGVADILGPVAVLLGFAAVFLVAGISRVRYE